MAIFRESWFTPLILGSVLLICSSSSSISYGLSTSSDGIKVPSASGQDYVPGLKGKLNKKKFIGDWIVYFKRTLNECDWIESPEAFNSSLGIAKDLTGSDYVDGSPFFKGKITQDKIKFKRSRYIEEYLQAQSLVMTYRNERSSRVTLEVEITSTDGSICTIRYAGTGVRM